MAIGANALVFSVLNALILHPLHVPNADTLWAIQHGNEDSLYEAYPDYLDLRDRNRRFEGLADDSPAARPILGLSKEDACALHVGRTVANIATGVRFSTKPVELSMAAIISGGLSSDVGPHFPPHWTRCSFFADTLRRPRVPCASNCKSLGDTFL